MEIICHESVNAAFAYRRRVKGMNWVDYDNMDEEEEVCYPAGIIAKRINAFVHECGLYK